MSVSSRKSGKVGLDILGSFLTRAGLVGDKANAGLTTVGHSLNKALEPFPTTQLVKRVIACLDVRANDQGDLVVTKGDQYDVREAPSVKVMMAKVQCEILENQFLCARDITLMVLMR